MGEELLFGQHPHNTSATVECDTGVPVVSSLLQTSVLEWLACSWALFYLRVTVWIFFQAL